MTTPQTLSERADELEVRQMRELGARIVKKSLLFKLADGEQSLAGGIGQGTGERLLMGEDPRLPRMPEKPTLLDFFKYRFDPSHQHLLQSANLARKNGLPEKMVLACLLHDIAVVGFIRSDHGYWGAQLIEPYVDEEVSWAIRMHQSLRFFADESVGYGYPENYVRMFGEDYRPEPYIVAEYELKLRVPKRCLKLMYHASSGNFAINLSENLGEVPDVSSLSSPLSTAQAIADKASDALDKYSRYLGRNPEGRGTIEAHALLPEAIWSRFPCPEKEELRIWVANQVEAGGLVPVEDVIERLEGARPDKVGKRQLIGVADALARLGVGMAPDPRFALRQPRYGEPVVLFRHCHVNAVASARPVLYRL